MVSARRGVIRALMASVTPNYVQKALMDAHRVLEMVARLVELLLHARCKVVDPVVDYGHAVAVVLRPIVRVVLPIGTFVASRSLVVTGRIIGLWIGTSIVVGRCVLDSLGGVAEGTVMSGVETPKRGLVMEGSIALVGIAVRTIVWMVGTVVGVLLFLGKYMLAAR